MVQRFEEAPRFQQTQMGVGMPPDDTTKDFIEKLIVDYGTSRGIKIALDVGVPAYAISMILNTPIAQQTISGATGDAKTMLGNVGSGILGLFNLNQEPALAQALQKQAMFDPRQQQAAGLLPEQQAIAQQQAQTQQQIINEINQANQQAQQTGGNFVSGPAGMSGPSSSNPTGFGSNIAGNITIGKADGGLVSLFKKGF